MSLSTSSFNRMAVLFFCLALLVVDGCAGQRQASPPVLRGGIRIAVFPFDNLSGGKAPLQEMRQQFLTGMGQYGIQTVPEAKIEAVLAKHRTRYTGGMDSLTAETVRSELAADAVLITNVELYDSSAVPKIGLLSRLVTTGKTLEILWMDSVGLAGDESPGLLNVGIIADSRVLREKAVRRLIDSLAAYLADRNGGMAVADARRGKFAPKVHYRAPLREGKKYRLAILPFHNETERRSAGEILSLHFVRHLARKKGLEVIEPGAVRQKLLNLRMVMNEGISLPDVEVIGEFLDADLIIAGRCLQYEDYQGGSGAPRIMFSVLMIERQNGKMLWSSVSYNEGDNGVRFFDFGKIYTAGTLASRMTQAVAAQMAK